MGTKVSRQRTAELLELLGKPDMSPEQLDEILQVPPGTVRRWRDTGDRIPKEPALTISMLLELERYEAGVEALGLTECREQERLWALVARFPPEERDGREATRAFADYDRHTKACATCRENQARIERELGPHPFNPSRTTSGRLIMPILEWASRPWSLVLTLPLTLFGLLAGFLSRAPGDQVLSSAARLMGVLGFAMVFSALHTLWRDLRD